MEDLYMVRVYRAGSWETITDYISYLNALRLASDLITKYHCVDIRPMVLAEPNDYLEGSFENGCYD